MGFNVNKPPENRPDFMLVKNGKTIFVEAVTTNPEAEKFDMISTSFEKEDEHLFFLKLRTILLKKIKKKYWELPWVSEHPFIIAIAPFHSSEALNVTDFEVRKYLYGVTINRANKW
jgi:hypothetical protein